MDSRRSNDQHSYRIMQLKFLILFALAAFVAAQNTDIKTVTDDLEGLKTIGTNLKTAIENADPNSVPDDLVRI